MTTEHQATVGTKIRCLEKRFQLNRFEDIAFRCDWEVEKLPAGVEPSFPKAFKIIPATDGKMLVTIGPEEKLLIKDLVNVSHQIDIERHLQPEDVKELKKGLGAVDQMIWMHGFRLIVTESPNLELVGKELYMCTLTHDKQPLVPKGFEVLASTFVQ